MVDVNSFFDSPTQSYVYDFITSYIPAVEKKNDKEVVGIGGFTAYAALSIDRSLASTAPDVVLEDGSVISDTIFLSPVVVKIEGEVSDINIPIDTTDDIVQASRSAIGVVTSYLPERTKSQINKVDDMITDASNAVREIDKVINDGIQIMDLFGYNIEDDDEGNPPKPLQEQFIDAIDQIHFGKALIKIDTAYRTYENMRVTSFDTSQIAGSNAIGFSITAKQIRVRSLTLVASTVPQNKNPSNNLNGQTTGEVDKGVNDGEEVPKSFLKAGYDVFFGG